MADTTTPQTATIRDATPADAEAVAQVHVDTWRDTYPGLVPDTYLVKRLDVTERMRFWRKAIRNPPADEHLQVAVLDKVVGFVSYGPCRHSDAKGEGEIYGLYVLPEAQGLGLGRALVDAAARRFAGEGRGEMVVEALRENPARHFYQAVGAQISGQGTHRFAGVDLPVVFYRWVDLNAFA